MLIRFKTIVLFFVLSLPIAWPTTCLAWYDDGSYWDYHGSGRDHPYSAYIDRHNYVGPADYALIGTGYLDGPLYINNVTPPAITPVPAQLITQVPAPPIAPPDEFIVNIPNAHGGYNAVVIKRAGSGFVGPRGEYYPEFPKIFQLQMKYQN